VNQIFLPRMIRQPGNVPSKLSLVTHYKCPEQHFHNEILRRSLKGLWRVSWLRRDAANYFFTSICRICWNTRNWYIPDTVLRHFDSPSNPCAANWFLCYKGTRHVACFDLFRPVPRKFEFSGYVYGGRELQLKIFRFVGIMTQWK